MADDEIKSFGRPESPWEVPKEDLARQAIPPIRGYVYQLHQSAAAWINLAEGDLLHLEVAENFSEIIKALDTIDDVTSPDIDVETLLFRLSASSNPVHRSVRAELIKRILDRAINIHHYRYVANMLRAHTRHVVELVDNIRSRARSGQYQNTTWLLPQVELACEERSINEVGHHHR